jgi:hypothetical protein
MLRMQIGLDQTLCINRTLAVHDPQMGPLVQCPEHTASSFVQPYIYS